MKKLWIWGSKTQQMQKLETFTYGNFYHLYNRGINSCNIFNEEDNFRYFLSLYEKYVDPIAETYAWVLMPNHFHFLVRVNDAPTATATPVRVLNPDGGRRNIGTPSQQLSKLFNAYAQAFNKRFERHGSLFERPFKRKMVTDDNYLRQLVLYIHNNPVHHGFCDDPEDYPWSSYQTCVTAKPTKLKRDTVIEMFDDKANFIYMHNEKIEVTKIEKWLEI